MRYASGLKFHTTVYTFHRVIICSDEPTLGALYGPYLSEIPLHVVAHSSFADLLSVALQHKPDVVLGCITDPESHVTVLQKVKMALPAVHVVTTGLSLDESAMRRLLGLGLSGHVDRMLSRPRDVSVMIEQLFEKTSHERPYTR